MTENKRFYYAHGVVWDAKRPNGLNGISINDLDKGLRVVNWLNELNDKCDFLEIENENLKITIKARDVLIKVCEKKFCELGFIITVDEDGYVIE